MMDRMKEAVVAVDWWASLLADPTQGETRDDLEAPQLTPDQTAAFRKYLYEAVEHAAMHTGSVWLDTENGPGGLLDDAMSAANIPGIYRRLLLPRGASMAITPGRVTAALAGRLATDLELPADTPE